MGVDGVRERWLAAVLDLDPGGDRPPTVSWLLGTAAEVLGAVGPDVVGCGVDVPVGLVSTGLRSAEQQARALLGPRAGSSIFTTAPQPAFAVARRLGGTRASRPEADAASRAAGAGGISTQAWGIADKVLEVEDAVRALGPAGDRVVEVHPETSFASVARHFGRAAPASKRSAPGVAHRMSLLEQTLPGLQVGPALADVPDGPGAARRVPVDDALDALVAACSALRHAYGRATVLGVGTAAVWSDGDPAPGRGVLVV